MLSIVGIGAAPTTDFLMRTEGVALLTGAGLLWAVRTGTSPQPRIALASLAAYYIVGSLVDLRLAKAATPVRIRPWRERSTRGRGVRIGR